MRPLLNQGNPSEKPRIADNKLILPLAKGIPELKLWTCMGYNEDGHAVPINANTCTSFCGLLEGITKGRAIIHVQGPIQTELDYKPGSLYLGVDTGPPVGSENKPFDLGVCSLAVGHTPGNGLLLIKVVTDADILYL